MGVIKEGRVSGTLPKDEAFAVHYPGYPKTTSRAIQTLGGTEGILKARISQSNRLELHFRPEDPYSHPAFGELSPCNNLLLKISKKKCSNRQTAEASIKLQECSTSGVNDAENPKQPFQVEVERPEEEEEEEEEESNLCADIVCRVSEAYNFDGMADYQHVLPVHANAARKRKGNWVEAEETSFEKGGFMDVDQEDVMMILPPLFSPKDMPENVVLRPSTILSSKKNQEVAVHYSAQVDLEPGLAIDFNIKEVPKNVNWEEHITQGSEQWEWQMTVSKLFEERPIWPKESVTERLLQKGLKFSHLVLKRLLLGVAYYFSNGPFRRFWIRKGYDPRKDPESRIYQRTDFRVPEPLRNYADANVANNLTHKWGDLCSFQVFPYKFQMILQLFELDDDYIQQEIRKPPKLETCDPKTGWFSECVLDCLRLRVAVRFLSVYPKTGAESILKSCSNEFEKLKRSCLYKDVFNSHQEEHQQTNKGDGDKERPKSSDNKEDEVEAEDEEELDAYDETLNLGDEDDEISLQPDTYLDMKNNSRTYLQELFGSFPSTGSGTDAIQAADTSDGEYEIYEQFGDDNYSDDDDDDDDGGDDS
ncbi:hypothetical protein ES332_D08G129000v1 [Gossypium tomentosum]|uniref:Transcription factor IIIC subunit 5 HTH domain-containing protein n=1 Tax=Gossypium tomentosum TaxID=34277 RepID=A0A5D2JUE4_GOSTO|nr:hypothetical protein ES332_D08G129000v1 [Gossypium tomentosum]TYH58044.1 hypothetical protein ES332_D08G129000v1 [Gossypium tomentosum]TYH58045.1 hypothetical protein ES332_D08G129000v1 [Gossypium tomentosum]